MFCSRLEIYLIQSKHCQEFSSLTKKGKAFSHDKLFSDEKIVNSRAPPAAAPLPLPLPPLPDPLPRGAVVPTAALPGDPFSSFLTKSSMVLWLSSSPSALSFLAWVNTFEIRFWNRNQVKIPHKKWLKMVIFRVSLPVSHS